MNFPRGTELVIILILLILVFGWKRLPDAARSLGRSARVFKSEVEEMKKDGKSDASEDSVQGQTGEQRIPPQVTPPPAQGYQTPPVQQPPQGQQYEPAPQAQPYQAPPQGQQPYREQRPQQAQDPTAPDDPTRPVA